MSSEYLMQRADVALANLSARNRTFSSRYQGFIRQLPFLAWRWTKEFRNQNARYLTIAAKTCVSRPALLYSDQSYRIKSNTDSQHFSLRLVTIQTAVAIEMLAHPHRLCLTAIGFFEKCSQSVAYPLNWSTCILLHAMIYGYTLISIVLRNLTVRSKVRPGMHHGHHGAAGNYFSTCGCGVDKHCGRYHDGRQSRAKL
jgi:hypothetical protein